jgi:lysozyme
MSALAYAVALVKKWEGCRLEAYPDPATGGDPWTIGWGSTGPGITMGVRWSQAQADDRLAIDVDRFMKGVRSVLRKPATDAQLGAMTSLAYNIGVGAFKDSTLLRKFNAGDIAGAAAEFPKWRRANGKVMQGLVNRRADEQKVFREGAA